MESVNVHLAKIDELILRIEDVLEASKSTAFNNSRVTVDKNKIYDIIDEIKPYLDDIARDLPEEIAKAKRIVADREKILEDASSKAALMIRTTQDDIGRQISEHEISKKAEIRAEALTEDARKYAKELRINAHAYVDDLLQKVEEQIRGAQSSFSKSVQAIDANLNETLDVIFDNRQELRGEDSR